MGIVKPLSQDVYSKIAAGEVIERPLSVVKELVENSLDAQAQNIRIELEEGGKRTIRIHDDGTGFFPEDILPAFSRHSTSKLAQLEDFDHLRSLGFRGEALPSISQVSQISIVSSREKSGLGIAVNLDHRGEISREETVCAKGTVLTVSDLFYNFPVRKKFLKSDRTELNAILRYVEQVALAYWSKGFTLSHNGRTLFSFPAASTLDARIYQIFGREFVQSLRLVQGVRDSGWRLFGWVSGPRMGGRDRQRQFFFVNGRPVKEKTLMAAFNQAYKGALEKEHQPQGVLLLEMPPHEIDVNIHPMKLEIKFADNQAVFSWIYHNLTRVLREESPPTDSFRGDLPGWAPVQSDGRKSGGFESGNALDPEISRSAVFEHRSEVYESAVKPLLAGQDKPFRLIGQYLNSYIIIEKEGELVLVDQHNAHETIIYNRLEQHLSQEGKVPAAVTLFPILCELSPREWAMYEEKKEELASLGFDLEPLGERSLSIRSYPGELSDAQARETLLVLLHDDGEITEGKGNKRLATVACKAAIKVNHPLHDLEMIRLLNDFFALEQHDFCPHGRPIVINFSIEEIEKRLKRR